MAHVNVHNVQVLDGVAPFTDPLQFEITFECVKHIADGAWRGRACARRRLCRETFRY